MPSNFIKYLYLSDIWLEIYAVIKGLAIQTVCLTLLVHVSHTLVTRLRSLSLPWAIVCYSTMELYAALFNAYLRGLGSAAIRTIMTLSSV